MEEGNKAARDVAQVDAQARPGPPDRLEGHFSCYGDASARQAVMAEYNRTLRVYRDTGVVDARQRADYTNGDGGRFRGQALYNANREAVAEIRRWQAGTWEPPALEEESVDEDHASEADSSPQAMAGSDAADEESEEKDWTDAERHDEDDVLETEESSGISGHRADSETDSMRPWAISEADFADARQRLDRLKQRLARIEREAAEEGKPGSESFVADAHALIRGVQVDLGQRSRLHSYHPTVAQLDIARAPAELPANIDTEHLLNALIGECHFLMREVAFRSMCQSAVLEDRMDWVKAAMNLATTGAKVAKSVSRLRHGPPIKETHHSMSIENKVAALVQGGGGA